MTKRVWPIGHLCRVFDKVVLCAIRLASVRWVIFPIFNDSCDTRCDTRATSGVETGYSQAKSGGE